MGRKEKFAQGGTPLSAQVRDFPASAYDAELLNSGELGPLNPAWVEALMGWPIGWTDVDCDSPLAIPGPVMGRGTAQHDWEPPRMVKAREVKGRSARIKACGNGVVRGLGAIAKARADSVMSGRS
jgi:DNA (cytosine-5)-methyltransferase 1